MDMRDNEIALQGFKNVFEVFKAFLEMVTYLCVQDSK